MEGRKSNVIASSSHDEVIHSYYAMLFAGRKSNVVTSTCHEQFNAYKKKLHVDSFCCRWDILDMIDD